MFILDSNIYIHAFRDATFGEAFQLFHQRHLPRTVLSTVVVFELLVGADSPAREKALRRGLVDPFQKRRRIHVPSQSTWETVAEMDRRLRKKGYASRLAQRSFMNDMLIAASAREIGATIITENTSDFADIAKIMPIRFMPPWEQGAPPL